MALVDRSMADEERSLRLAAIDLTRFFEESSYPGAIVGGFAITAYRRVRATVDVDGVLLTDFHPIPTVLDELSRFGFEPQPHFSLQIAQREHLLLLRHIPTGVKVDLAIGMLPFQVNAIQNARTIDLPEGHVRIVGPEDIVIMKAIAGRPQDFLDIEAILQNKTPLDRELILGVIKEMASILEEFDHTDQITALFTNYSED